MTSQPPYQPAPPTLYLPPTGATPGHGPGPIPQQWSPQGPQPPQAVKKRRWLHVLGYPLVLLLGLGIGAAGGNDDGAATTQPQTSASAGAAKASSPARKPPASAPAKPPVSGPGKAPAAGPGIGDKVRDGKFEFMVTKVKPGVATVGDSMLGKKAQGQFVLVSITVANIGDEPQTLVGDAQKLFDTQGRKFSVDTEAAVYLADSNSIFEEINPGNSVKGTLLFDIPDGVKPARLELHDSPFSGGVDVGLR